MPRSVDRLSASVVTGADWDLGVMTLGYGATLQANVLNPTSATPFAPFEIKHHIGLRTFIDDWTYLQANVRLQPSDTYGIADRTVLAGIGTRLFGSFGVAAAPVAIVPEPGRRPRRPG